MTRVQVLLAAELHRDALRVADEGVAAQHPRCTARRPAAPSCCSPRPWRRPPPVTRPLRADRSAEALRMFRRQQRAWWAAHAELVLLESRFDTGDTSAALLRAATSSGRALGGGGRRERPEARLLCGRLALARGRRSAAIDHLRAAAARRPRDVRARSTAWLARAVLADVEGRPVAMLTACSRGLDLIDVHLGTLGATELRAQATARGDDLARLALGMHVSQDRRRDPAAGLERALAGHCPRRPAGAPGRRARDDPGPRRPAGRRGALADDDSGVGLPALRREQRRLEEAVRRRALHRPGAGSGRPRPSGSPSCAPCSASTDLVELTEVGGQLFAVIAVGRPTARHAPHRSGRSRRAHPGPRAVRAAPARAVAGAQALAMHRSAIGSSRRCWARSPS